MSRHHAKPGRTSFMASAALHVTAMAALWTSGALRPEPMVFETYAIELYSPPPVEAPDPTPASPPEQLIIEQPQPTPPAPPPPPPQREPDPEPQPPTEPEPPSPPEPPAPTPEPDRPPEPARDPDARADASGGDNLNIRMEGLRRDYPEYYDNIVQQIQRCFRPSQPGARWVTVVYFVITRDGRAADLDFVRQSGNVAFDYEALGAVDCAGRDARFGPLPDELPLDRLPVQFTFSPAGAGPP